MTVYRGGWVIGYFFFAVFASFSLSALFFHMTDATSEFN
jgi:hypothetical protein